MRQRLALRWPSARVGLYFLLLLALALRLYHLDASSLWWDESLSYVRATSDLGRILANQIMIQNLATRDLHPPLYFLLLHVLVGAAGVGEFALRYLSTFANVLSLPLFYLVARQWFHPRAGLIAAGLAALSPFYVYYSQEARPYTLVLFWSLLAVYALGLLAGGRESRRKDFPLFPLGLYGLAAAAMLATHYLSFLLFPFHALLIYFRSPGRTRYLALIPFAIFALAFPLIPIVSPNLAGPDAGGPQFVPWFVLFRDLLNSFSIGVTASLDQLGWLDLVLLLGFGLGLVAAWRGRRGGRQAALFLLGYLLIPPVALELGSYLRPMYMNSRHLITASVPFYLGLAVAVEALLRRWQSAALGLAALAVFGYGATQSLGNLYFDPDYAKDDHRAWLEYLREHIRDGDGLILVAPQAETIFNYYARDLLPWISLPNLVPDLKAQERADFVAVRDAYQKWSRIWLLELHAPVADSTRHIWDLLNKLGSPSDRTLFHGQSTEIVLTEFLPDSPYYYQSPQIPHPLSVSVTPDLELLGEALPSQAAAGERQAVKLFWRLRTPVGEDWGTSLVVKDARGQVWGQADSAMFGNQWPTSQWPVGQIGIEVHDLPVDPAAPPGRYDVSLEVYRLATGERLGPPVPLGSLPVTRLASPLDPNRLALTRRIFSDFGSIQFLGYNQEVTEARPGDVVPLILYFRLTGAPPPAVAGRVAVAPAWAPFWNLEATPFALDTRGRMPGDIVRVIVPVHFAADRSAGSYLLKLWAEAPTDAWTAWSGIGLGTARVLPLARTAAMPDTAQRLQARFGESIELAGYQVTRAGPRLDVSLYWKSRAPVLTSYKVFVHLLDSKSQIVAQQDDFPQQGARPTTTWTGGEVIADAYALELPPGLPPGRYPLEVGLYNPSDNVRLPAFQNERPSGEGRILLDPLTLP